MKKARKKKNLETLYVLKEKDFQFIALSKKNKNLIPQEKICFVERALTGGKKKQTQKRILSHLVCLLDV